MAEMQQVPDAEDESGITRAEPVACFGSADGTAAPGAAAFATRSDDLIVREVQLELLAMPARRLLGDRVGESVDALRADLVVDDLGPVGDKGAAAPVDEARVGGPGALVALRAVCVAAVDHGRSEC